MTKQDAGEHVMKPPYRCASCGHEWAEDTVWCPKCKPAKAGGNVSLNDEADRLLSRVTLEGTGRDAGNSRVLCLFLSRPYTDDEMRFIHNACKRAITELLL